MKKRVSVTIKDLYNLYKKYPEYASKVNVLTRFGYYPIEACDITAKNSEVISLETELGKKLNTSPDHLLCNDTNNWIKVKELTTSDKLLTCDGVEKIKHIEKLLERKDLYDLQVAEKHEFYANGIVSHNSQLFTSLCFALFGQTSSNIKNTNIHNKYVSGKETRVVLYFQIEDHEYKVVSGFNKYGAPYCNLYEIVDSVENDLTKSTIQETRKFLENEILNCDISIFLRTILLSSDQNYNFFRLRKNDKKEFIEKLFDISVFGNMYSQIHKDILSLDKDILAHQNKLIVLNETLSNYEDRIAKFNETNKSKISELTEKLTKLNLKHDELKNQTVSINSVEVKKYQNAIDLIDAEISKIDKNIKTLQSECSDIDLTIHKLNSSKTQKQKLIDKHAEILAKLCNDCKKIFSDYYNINTYIEEISQMQANIDKNTEVFSSKSQTLQSYKDKISFYESKQQKAEQKIKELTEQYNKTSSELNSLENSILHVDTELQNIKNSVNPYTDLYDKNKQDIAAELSQLDEIKEKYTYLKFAENIVSQDTLRKFIISDLIGLLNNKIKSYLMKLGAKFNVVFDADMNYEFITEGGTCEYDNFSAGERARLMIAACFAFRDFMYIRNNFSSNILVLDEFIDGAIDSLAINSILDILKDFSNIWNQNIFVISHRKEVDPSIFDNVIQIVKTNNIAKITFL